MTISEPMWTNSRYLNLMWGNQKSKKSEENWEHSSSKMKKWKFQTFEIYYAKNTQCEKEMRNQK